jgi:hypothetical protein
LYEPVKFHITTGENLNVVFMFQCHFILMYIRLEKAHRNDGHTVSLLIIPQEPPIIQIKVFFKSLVFHFFSNIDLHAQMLFFFFLLFGFQIF